MDTPNRSAIVVKPKQPFLRRLHAADPSSREICWSDLSQEPTIYRVPECDTDADVAKVLRKLCEEIFEEKLPLVYGRLNVATRPEQPGLPPVV